MQKCILFAALLGFAMSASVMSLYNDGYFLNETDYSLMWHYKLDWSYELNYAASMDDEGWHSEAWGFRTWSNLSFALHLTIPHIYTWEPTITLGFFDVTPYRQIVKMYRPAVALADLLAGNPWYWDLQLIGEYSIWAAWIQTNIAENAGVQSDSTLDYIRSYADY